DLVRMQLLKPLGESTAGIVLVPVERHQTENALRRLQSERLHIVDLKDEARQLEFAGQAVLGCLFQRVRQICSGVGESDGVSTGRLRLDKKGRKIRRAEWRMDCTHDLA